MQFSSIIVALFAATALALPTSNAPRNFITDAASSVVDEAKDVGGDVVDAGKSAVNAVEDGAGDVVDAAKGAAKAIPGELQKAFGADCELGKCAAALGPTAVGCGIAAAQGFADPLADLPCIAAALNSVANVPASCSKCHVPDLGIFKE